MKCDNLKCKHVLTDNKLKKYVSSKTFKQYLIIKQKYDSIPNWLAIKLAEGIKQWAKSLNVQFFAHWFSSIGKAEAEKYISMHCSNGTLGKIDNLTAGELLHTQVDSSSFVQSKNSQIHRACGYAVWNISSPVFIKESGNVKILCVPSVFYSHSQEALDFKIPLIKSCKQLSLGATQLLHLLGNTNVKSVSSDLGCEQEYFLIKEKYAQQRLDLKMCGQTLFGSNLTLSATPQNNYYTPFTKTMHNFMTDVTKQCFKVGIFAKLQHGEVAPNQYELVCHYTSSVIATDQNTLISSILQQLSKKYGYKLLLAEKPFAGVSGSGKHNNWSLSTNEGVNLIDFTKVEPIVFLTFFTAVLSAVDKYYPLLMVAVTSVENSFRLGGHEAPSTIFSVDIGEPLKVAINNFLQTSQFKIQHKQFQANLPFGAQINHNINNRNRTSTFAYTGNKFEFRAVGSSQNVKLVNLILNTIVANEINNISQQLKQHGANCITDIIKKKISKHMRIVYNQNCYHLHWQNVAKQRRIVDFKNNPSIYNILTTNQILKLFENNNIYSKTELKMVQNALYTNYYKSTINMANIFCQMLITQILPTLNTWLSNCLSQQNIALKSGLKVDVLTEQISQINTCVNKLYSSYEQITMLVSKISKQNLPQQKCKTCYIMLLPLIKNTRNIYDSIEPQIPFNLLPFATYGQILSEN